MAEGTLSHLNYGHAGTPTFYVDTRTWSFSRQLNGRKLKQVKIRDQSAIESIPGSVQFPTTAASTRFTNASHHVKALVRDRSQLAAAAELLPELAVLSAAIDSTSSTYDPLVGNLYSTGSISSREGTKKTSTWPRRIAASVTGESGNILRLSFFRKEKLGWEDDQGVYIKGDSLRDGSYGYWNQEAAPIQQVCFAQSGDRSTLLGIRFPTNTVILRPFHAHQPLPARYSSHYRLPPSEIDAHPILTLDTDQSGGSPHVDIAFNPDYQLQFAVVDQNQTWTVWDIDHGSRGNKYDEYSLSKLGQGTVTPPEDTRKEGEDGWARILWIGDVNTLAVCTRRHLSIIAMHHGVSSYLPCPDLIPRRSSDWILSLQAHPSLRSLFFVLSSTELFLIAVTTGSEAVNANAGPVGARVLSSWRHYRSTEDMTLAMSVQMTAENETCVMIHSRLNTLVQMYTFETASSQPNSLVSSASPTTLDLMTDVSGHILQTVVEPFEFVVDESLYAQGLGRQHHSRGLLFFRLFMLRSDLSVYEAVFCSAPAGDGGIEHDGAIRDLSWSKSYRQRSARTAQYIREMDDFLQPDGIEPMEFPALKLSAQAPAFPDIQEATLAQRMVDHSVLYDAMISQSPDHGSNSDDIDVSGLLNQVKEIFNDRDGLSNKSSGTLLENATARIAVPDIDEASSALQDLLLDIEQVHVTGTDNIALSMAPLHSLHLDDDEQNTISGLYDGILKSWIASLPQNVPVRVRQHSERLARRVAVEITLAGVRYLRQGPKVVDTDAQPIVDNQVGMTMPILSSQPLDSSPPRLPSTQPLPTPPLSQSGSQPPLSGLSQTPFTEPQSLNTNSRLHSAAQLDPVARLSRHLRFKEDVLPVASIPDNVQQLLAQWEPGTDPHTYDWTEAENANRIDELDEYSQQQLEKARKKKERRERRQRREDELAKSQPSSQPFTAAPIVYPRSSPGPTLGGMGSSQIPLHLPPLASRNINSQSQGSSQPFVAHSQAEPGKFGGRLEKKKKRKGGRVSGF